MVGIFPILELPRGDAKKGLGGGHVQAFLDLPRKTRPFRGSGFRRCRSESGIVRPNTLAALRLITSSHLAGGSAGRSAGLAPFRIRWT
jgi:hypothetical protein